MSADFEVRGVVTADDQASATMEKVGASAKNLAVGFSGVATSAFSLYNAYDRVADMQLNVDRANLKVNSSTNSLNDAQRRAKTASDALEKAQTALAEAIAQHGANSEEAARAQATLDKSTVDYGAACDDVSVAQERLNVAIDNAKQTQDNMNEAMMQSALQVVPTCITMVDNLSKIWNNFPDMSGMLNNLSTKISDTGISAKTAAIGVAAFIGGFLAGDAILKAVPEELRTIAAALMVAIAAVVAATVAWMAFHGTVTLGVAVPVILAAVGFGIAGIKSLVGFAEGGVVTKPTMALIGESGPEAVIPLEKMGAANVNAKIENNIKIGTLSGAANLQEILRAITKAVAKGTDEGLSSALSRASAERLRRRM